MSRRLLVREGLVALVTALAGCGAPVRDFDVGTTPHPSVAVAEWPALATDTRESITVYAALRSIDGAQIRVRAYLVAVSAGTPAPGSPALAGCAACSVGEQRAPRNEGRIGKTARARGPEAPGLPASATFSDDPPVAVSSPSSVPLRAVGAAEGLQARHVGHVFLLTGTFHARGEQGAELDVSDVRAIAP